MACNVARQVSGAYKTLQSQTDKKESEWQLLDFDPTSATFSFERDFGLSRDTLSITTLAGRRRYKLLNYQYAQRYLDGSWKYLASKLCLHKNGAYFFHLACEKDIPDKNIVDASTFMGVDVGINFLAVASTTDKNVNSLQAARSRITETSDAKNAGDYRKQAVAIWALDPV
jgi:transposase